jgi:nucleoside-diphosphate-sugar epimerase
VVGYDLGDDTSRLRLVLGDAADRVLLVRGDVTDLESLGKALDDHEVTRVVHLAALQVPFVRANPPLGMRINVAGTATVFEAAARRLDRIPAVAYASSAAVYGPADPSPAPESGGTEPSTLYGVSKLADEGMARVYAADAGLPTVGLRPYVVYGPGRDQGLTSGPTVAMQAAARGEPSTIGFTGTAQYDYAPDVARAFVTAASATSPGAAVYNLPGVAASVEDVVAAIRTVVPAAEIAVEGGPLPFPAELEAVGFEREIGPCPRTPLEVGVAATITHFRAAA